MTTRLRPRRIIAALAVALLLAASVPAAAQSPLRFTRLPQHLLGLATGPEALTCNPAGLGFVENFRLAYHFIHSDPEYRSHLVGAAGGIGRMVGLGMTGEYINPPGAAPFGRISLGAAVRPLKGLSFGVAYHNIISRSDQDLDELHRFDLGLTARIGRWVSLGARLTAVNSPWLKGSAHPRSFSAGLGVRPIGNHRLVVGAEIEMWDGLPVASAQAPPVRFMLRGEPIDGLAIFAQTDHRFDALWLGLRVDISGLGVMFSGGAHTPGAIDSFAVDSYAAGLEVNVPVRRDILPAFPRAVRIQLAGKLEPIGGRGFMRRIMGQRRRNPTPLELLYVAARDKRVGAVVLDIAGLKVGFATLLDLRHAITTLRKRGKTVIANISEAGDKEYFVASAATKVHMDPLGWLTLDGIRARLLYFRDGLKKIGVRVDAVAVGTYKSAPEQFTESGPTPRTLREERKLIDNLYDTLVDGVSRSRKLPRKKVEQLIEKGLFTARRAIAAGLVDELSYPFGKEDSLPVAVGDPPKYYTGPRPAIGLWGSRPAVAIIPIKGSIVARRGGQLPFMDLAEATSIVRLIQAAATAPHIKAVVLRVDSGGGDIMASEYIWRAVYQLRRKKPVVVSMGDMAASGAYYLACAANHILAERTTLTGSIGIYVLLPEITDLLDKLGIEIEVIQRGKRASVFDMNHIRDKQELAHIRDGLASLYAKFVARVARGRKLDRKRVEELAQGRVYTGARALELGLVDGLGGLSAAVAKAAALAKMKKEPTLEYLGSRPGLLKRLGINVKARQPLAASIVKTQLGQLLGLAYVFRGRPVYLYPYRLRIE